MYAYRNRRDDVYRPDPEDYSEKHLEALATILRSPVILDPTILVSPRHMRALAEYRKTLFVPASLAEFVEDEDWDTVESVLAELSWPFTRRPIIVQRGARGQLAEVSVSLNRYKASGSDLERLGQLYPQLWNLRNPVDKVLGDEYAFLRHHSSLMTRILRPLYALRDRGIPLLDTGDRLLAAKKRILGPHTGLKVFLASLVATATLIANPPPELRILAFAGQEILIAFDPDPESACSPSFASGENGEAHGRNA